MPKRQSEISDMALDAHYLAAYAASIGHEYFDQEPEGFPDPDDDGWEGWEKESERKVE